MDHLDRPGQEQPRRLADDLAQRRAIVPASSASPPKTITPVWAGSTSALTRSMRIETFRKVTTGSGRVVIWAASVTRTASPTTPTIFLATSPLNQRVSLRST